MANQILSTITEAMRDHDREHAPGSETAQWQAFCEDAQAQYGVLPYADEASDVEVDEGFADFWRAIAARDYAEADRWGDVSSEWLEAAARGLVDEAIRQGGAS